jgi:hypothetical protein
MVNLSLSPCCWNFGGRGEGNNYVPCDIEAYLSRSAAGDGGSIYALVCSLGGFDKVDYLFCACASRQFSLWLVLLLLKRGAHTD